MRMKLFITLTLLASSVCWGQSEYRIPLEGASPSLSLPLMVAGDGVLYVAYRSWTWLHDSDQLRLVEYDLSLQKELRHTAIAVPKVHGVRVAEGLYLSKDGQSLAYAETHNPCLVLLISAGDLSEIHRSTSLPFTHLEQAPYTTFKDLFAGFDESGLLSFAFSSYEGLRFVRIDPANLKVASDTTASRVHEEDSDPIVWLPSLRRTWTKIGAWKEYTENGQATGQWLPDIRDIQNGAIALGEGKLLAFYGIRSKGEVIYYSNHQQADLNLPCEPHPYGLSNDSGYAGAICVTSREEKDRLWGHILSSEFLLLKTQVPAVIWRRKMDFIDKVEAVGRHGEFYQNGDPLIYRAGNKIYVIALSKAAELAVYLVPLSASSG